MVAVPADLLFTLVLGHCVGDYLAQTLSMALQKKYSLGWCIRHCALYTGIVLVFTFYDFAKVTQSLYAFSLYGLVVFLSHFVLDKTDIVDKWLHFIGSRSYANADKAVKESTSAIYSGYMISYTALVQTVADNSLHVALMYFGLRLVLTFFKGK
jgi:hypothetical protein